MKNNINIKGFLFDLDGTLIQSMYEHFIAWKKTFIKYGVEIHENDFYPLEGSKLSEIVKIISKKNRIKKPNIKEIIKTKERYYNSSSNIIFYPGVENFIDSLIFKKIKKGIVTAGQKERVYNSLPINFLNKFDAVVTGNDTINGKPSPEPYLLGSRLLQLKKENCVVIENAPLGIKSAKAAGMFCIAISSTVEKSLLKEADILINNFNDLFKLDLLKIRYNK